MVRGLDNEGTRLLVSKVLDAAGGMEGLADIIGAFLVALEQRYPEDNMQKNCEYVASFRTRLSQEPQSAFEHEDLLYLDFICAVISMFLIVELPKTETREAVIDGMWKIREHLLLLRRSLSPASSPPERRDTE